MHSTVGFYFHLCEDGEFGNFHTKFALLCHDKMAVYECEVCEKSFPSISHLKRHQSKKKPCIAPEQPQDYRCEQCQKPFSHRTSLSRHQKSCTGPKKTMEQEVRDLRDQVQRLTGVSMVTQNTTNVTNITNNTINITVNNYGSEDQQFLESLSYADLKRILKLTPDNETILRMIKFIHINDEHPENKTVKLENKDSPVIQVHSRGRWRERASAPTLFDLICRNRMRFVDLEAILAKGMAKGKFEDLTKYLEKLEDMANAEDASRHQEFEFDTLVDSVREQLCNV